MEQQPQQQLEPAPILRMWPASILTLYPNLNYTGVGVHDVAVCNGHRGCVPFDAGEAALTSAKLLDAQRDRNRLASAQQVKK